MQVNGTWTPTIVAFCCNWCSYAGADLSGTNRLSYPANVKIIRIPCSCRCFGIVGMAAVNMKDGLVKLLKRDYLTHGISVTIEDENLINIDFHVIVAYGVSICTVSDNLIETVKYKVESFTGMKINKINIYVEGVRVID